MITKSPSEYKRNVNKRFWCGTQIYNQKKNRFFEMYFRRLSESNSKKKNNETVQKKCILMIYIERLCQNVW